MRPIERRAGVGLAPRRDIAVADQTVGRQRRICRAQRRNGFCKRLVLYGLVGKRIGAFEFHADREIIAGLAAFEAGLPSVPRALLEAHVLRDRPVAADDEMRGDAQARDLGKVRVGVGRQVVGEQAVYPRSAELTRRQADAVDHDQINLDARGPRVAIRGSHLPHPVHQPAFEVDPQILILVTDPALETGS